MLEMNVKQKSLNMELIGTSYIWKTKKRKTNFLQDLKKLEVTMNQVLDKIAKLNLYLYFFFPRWSAILMPQETP